MRTGEREAPPWQCKTAPLQPQSQRRRWRKRSPQHAAQATMHRRGRAPFERLQAPPRRKELGNQELVSHRLQAATAIQLMLRCRA